MTMKMTYDLEKESLDIDTIDFNTLILKADGETILVHEECGTLTVYDNYDEKLNAFKNMYSCYNFEETSEWDIILNVVLDIKEVIILDKVSMLDLERKIMISFEKKGENIICQK